MARTYCDLALALYQQARYAEAEPLAKWALSVRVADRYARPEALFQCLFTLGSIDSAQKHYADAEPLFQSALTLQELVLPEGDVRTLTTLDALATVFREQGKYREAESLYRRELAILERITPEENLDLAYTAEQYAIDLRRMNRADEAQPWEGRRSRFDKQSPPSRPERGPGPMPFATTCSDSSSRKTGVAAATEAGGPIALSRHPWCAERRVPAETARRKMGSPNFKFVQTSRWSDPNHLM